MSINRRKNGTLIFSDYPNFKPNLTPKEVLEQGAFGGTYFRPIYSNINKKQYKNQHLEYPKEWFENIDIAKFITSSKCNKKLNKYKATSGLSLVYWEDAGWIKPIDPYGWFQWYCRFYMGRRSIDDERQISRWNKICGPKGRWKTRLINSIQNKNGKLNDYSISPVLRQLLHQWAFKLKKLT